MTYQALLREPGMLFVGFCEGAVHIVVCQAIHKE